MKYFAFRHLLLSAVCFVVAQSVIAGPSKRSGKTNHSFDVVVFGDMPYTLPQDYVKFENLLHYVNKQDQAFNVFVGDIKSSKVPCSNDVYQKVYDYFNWCRKPLIYTPGDNEWTDCEKPAQKFDRNERLVFLRSLFFKDSKSLGKERMELGSEASYPAYSRFVENKLWSFKTITFATVHLVGSNNNSLPNDPGGNVEFLERCRADSFWLDQTFRQAKKDNSPGIVIFIHADMFTPGKAADGFDGILAQLATLVKDYGKPVLLVNGDSHRFLVDKPMFADEQRKHALINFTRLQVFGEDDVHGVTIHINPDNPSLFDIEQLIIPGNN